MKQLLLVFASLAAIAFGRPAPAEAHFSLALGLPGLSLLVHEPCPPPVAYGPAPVVYGPAPVYYYRPPVYYVPAPIRVRHWGPGRGHHYGWYRHGRWDD